MPDTSAFRVEARSDAARVRLMSIAVGLALAIAALSGQEPPQGSPAVETVSIPRAAGPESTSPDLSVQITSPLGRTGMTGPVRIVARIASDPKTNLSPVQFYVDDALVGEDKDGPPYAVEWVDSNPFLPRKIVVQVADSLGGTARDTVDLKPQELVDAAEVQSVVLEPMVFDRRGRPVNGLTVADFAVAENDVPQVIDMAVPDTVPAVYTLLIDTSQSMGRRIDFVRDAAGRLPSHLRPRDSVVVVPFSKTLGVITGPTQDRETIASAISTLQPAGGTAILESLSQVAEQVSSNDDGRHIVVLLTDGYDENSDIPFDRALDRIKSARATVYVIGIAGVAGISLKGEDVLRRLATETGGRAFFPSRESQLADVHKLIAEDVQLRYVLSYEPSNKKRDGTWRRVKLTTTNPEHTVRVRDGYRAPSPAPIRPQIELTIRDLQRRLIDVTPADLEVFEDGEPQKIEAFQEALSPVSIVLALDESGSMRRDIDAVVAAARSFVLALPDKDRLAVMMFSDRAEFVHDLTTNRETSLQAVGRYRAVGGTALYDAVFDSIARLKRADGRTALIVMTDGRDENNPGTAPGSVHTLDQVLASLAGAGTTVYPIGLGPNVDRPTLEKLAEASKGEAYFPADVSSLEAEYKRILENLRRRYVISYTSTNTARDGSWRKIEIRPARDGLSVEAQGGYFAPEDP
jgi:Ca-activated chloride channel family protein